MNQDRGVSPVISVILMLGLAVSIAAIASFTAFNLQNDVSTNPDITLQANDGDTTATVVDAGNVDELKLDGVTVNRDVSAGDTLDLAGAGLSASMIAVVNGQEQLVKQVETGAEFSEPNTESNTSTVSTGDLGGDGTDTNPFEISTDQELQAMDSNPTANYTLVNSIDAGKSGQWNGGAGFNPVGTFNGTFDGQGHTIAGLTIDRPTDEVGLFSIIDSRGEVKNVTVSTADVTGNNQAGGLVGFNRGTLKKSSASASVTGDDNVGGLVGQNFESASESYWLETNTDDDATGEINNLGATGVETGAASGGDFTLTDARGETASDTGIMGDLDFTNTWETAPGEFPQLRVLTD